MRQTVQEKRLSLIAEAERAEKRYDELYRLLRALRSAVRDANYAPFDEAAEFSAIADEIETCKRIMLEAKSQLMKLEPVKKIKAGCRPDEHFCAAMKALGFVQREPEKAHSHFTPTKNATWAAGGVW